MDNSNNRDVNPYVQRVDAPDGGADALRENYTQKDLQRLLLLLFLR